MAAGHRSDEQRELKVLERVYALLARLNRWPTWHELDDDLDGGAGIDAPWEAVRVLDRSLFFGLGAQEPSDTQTVGLTVRGLQRVPAASEDLRVLADTIIWAVEEARARHTGTGNVSVNTETITAQVSLPAAGRRDLLRRQCALWSSVPELTVALYGDADLGTWTVELGRKRLRPLRPARTAKAAIELLAASASRELVESANGKIDSGGESISDPSTRAPGHVPEGPSAGSSASPQTTGGTERVVAADELTYEVDLAHLLGAGLHGRVFAGTGPNGGDVAVKVVDLRSNAGTAPWLRDARLAEREVLLGARLAADRIAGVVPLITHKLELDRLLLFFPRASYSLADLIAGRVTSGRVEFGDRTGTASPSPTASPRALSKTDVRRVAVQLTKALVQLHEHGVLHRDIKPGNALLWEGTWCWADLGIARLLDRRTETVTFAGMGTREYTAPEVISGADQTVRSDVYSLGCTLYELATGSVPFPSDPFTGHLTEVADLSGVTDPVVARALTYALGKDHDSRVTAEQLLDMLSGASATSLELDGLRAVAERGRRRQDDLSAAQMLGERRALASQAAMTQFRRTWDSFIETVRSIDPGAHGHHEDASRCAMTLHDDRLLAYFGAPARGDCPATAVGHLSYQHVNENAVAVANIYAQADPKDDGVSWWKIVNLQPNGQPMPADSRAIVSLDALEQWLIAAAETRPGPPTLVVTTDVALTVQTLTDILVAEAEKHG